MFLYLNIHSLFARLWGMFYKALVHQHTAGREREKRFQLHLYSVTLVHCQSEVGSRAKSYIWLLLCQWNNDLMFLCAGTEVSYVHFFSFWDFYDYNKNTRYEQKQSSPIEQNGILRKDLVTTCEEQWNWCLAKMVLYSTEK